MYGIIKLLNRILDWLFGKPSVKWRVNVDGLETFGDITMTRFEFNQEATFTAVPLDRHDNPAGIEPGSATWEFAGTDNVGNDVSAEVVVTVDPSNELSATVRSLTTELTGTLTLRADGDPDAGEYAPIIGTESIVVDASNAVAFSLTGTTPVDV
jgi:hypothetical protein